MKDVVLDDKIYSFWQYVWQLQFVLDDDVRIKRVERCKKINQKTLTIPGGLGWTRYIQNTKEETTTMQLNFSCARF